ncbi:MAG: ABC-type transport auxiliary lipoprotein family protein [Zhengella sp.]|uniref:ABC-type transport auxiliary lipoprotein family protein n=1 Tax=Zhengella sp. TaxID=2282762 RepID=UPI001D6BE4AA|nr:membrane integrity-associated transporter subunit PqiC [Notoacmeibacter sp.]MCC0027345.1 membrane integrity-associated transporter subunit PqiC [Brucellaceae bacterium]
MSADRSRLAGKGIFRGLAAAVVTVGLSSCALIGGTPQPLDTFDLSAARPPSSGPGTVRRQVLVTEPVALKALDGENIMLRPAPGEIAYLDGAQWSDRLPKVIQARLIESFQRSERIRGVGRPGEGLAIDYQLITDVRSFEVLLDGGSPRARVALSVRLLNDRSGVVARQRVFEAEAPLAGSSNGDYVRALDAAFNQVAGEIVEWALRAI